MATMMLFLWVPLAEQQHHTEVSHLVCPEHGEQIHVGYISTGDSIEEQDHHTSFTQQNSSQQTQGDVHGDHCLGISVSHKKNFTPSRSPLVVSYQPHLARHSPRALLPEDSRSPLLLAPKTSPPPIPLYAPLLLVLSC